MEEKRCASRPAGGAKKIPDVVQESSINFGSVACHQASYRLTMIVRGHNRDLHRQDACLNVLSCRRLARDSARISNRTPRCSAEPTRAYHGSCVAVRSSPSSRRSVAIAGRHIRTQHHSMNRLRSHAFSRWSRVAVARRMLRWALGLRLAARRADQCHWRRHVHHRCVIGLRGKRESASVGGRSGS